MKKITFTYTRDNLDTPWYWQTPAGQQLSGMPQFMQENQDKIQQLGYFAAQGYKNIITITFSDEQIYQDFTAMVESDVTSDYAEYCRVNNITIESVVENV
jgi:hypothetical protein